MAVKGVGDVVQDAIDPGQWRVRSGHAKESSFKDAAKLYACMDAKRLTTAATRYQNALVEAGGDVKHPKLSPVFLQMENEMRDVIEQGITRFSKEPGVFVGRGISTDLYVDKIKGSIAKNTGFDRS